MTEKTFALQQLSARDRELIAAITRGDSVVSLSGINGYSVNWLSERLDSDPVFEHALYMAQRAELRRGASIGIRVLIELAAEDVQTDSGKKIKLEAAKALTQYAGHGQHSAGARAPGEKVASEMTLEEIEAALETAKRKASDSAKVIDQPPAIAKGSAQYSQEDVDILS